MIDRQRARAIVVAASQHASAGTPRQWLRLDERGTWEALAGELLEKTEEEAERKGATPEQVDESIALLLAIRAMDAVIAQQAKLEKR